MLKLPFSKLPYKFTGANMLQFAIITTIVVALITSVIALNSKIANQVLISLALEENVAKLTHESTVKEEELTILKSEDQYLINKQLEAEIENIHDTYKKAVVAYENLLVLKEKNPKASGLDKLFVSSLVFLAEKNYASASAVISQLEDEIIKEEQKIVEAVSIPESLPVKSEPPASGYTRQTVETSIGNFMVSIVAGDLSNTKIIVDTASAGDCFDNCPVLPLAEYVSRNGAYAGINGSYFCPADYPSCAGKTNTFDTLLMNKDKVYFNSDNNVYSNNPAVIFGAGYIRFVTAASQWGRDTGIDSMIMNYPLLVNNSNVSFGGDDDPKKGSKAGRSFVANKGSSIYIGVVHNATVGESARVVHAMGMENALNLDSGGSTALWAGGYRVGPGRNLPNAILFVRK
jgi:hypothetical protein